MTRRIGIRVGKERLARPGAIALLMGALALLLQLALSPPHMAMAGAKATAMAELSALTGESFVLCADAPGDESHGPAHSDADCSGLCCHLGHQLAAALPPPVAIGEMVAHRSAELRPAPRPVPTPQKRFSTAQPRGPPATV
jgi:hypothetical protein